MGYDPPGLQSRPDDTLLAGFSSLMPQTPKKPSLVSRALRLPFKILSLPIKAVGAIVRAPARLLGSRRA